MEFTAEGKASGCQRERWHHLPYMTHIITLRVRLH